MKVHEQDAHATSEGESRLELEHPRWVDVCERGDRVRGCADTIYKRTKVRIGRRRVAVDRLSAAEHVGVIEEIEALQPEQDRNPF